MSGGRRREAIWSGPTHLVGDTDEDRDVTVLGILLEKKRFKPHIGHSSLMFSTRNTNLLSWFEDQWGLLEGCKKLRFHS